MACEAQILKRVVKAGSQEAKKLLAEARWKCRPREDPALYNPSLLPPGQQPSSAPSHISPHLHTQLEVLLVETRRPHLQRGDPLWELLCFSRAKMGPGSGRCLSVPRDLPHFNTAYLIDHLRFRLQRKSCAVLLQPPGALEPPFIMALFITGDADPDLAPLAKDHPALYSEVKAVQQACPDRPGVFMMGIRANDNVALNIRKTAQGQVRGPALPVGYYAAKASKGSLLCDPESEVSRQVCSTARGMCQAEARISPHIAHLRSTAAPCAHHPGLLPGIPPSECPAFALGVSQGYSSALHTDDTYGSLTETIVWWTKDVPRDAQLSFCVWDVEVCFDLLAHPACMVMLHGSLMHGTPDLGSASRPHLETMRKPRHDGFGAVLVTKQDLFKQCAALGTLKDRMDSPAFQQVPRSLLFCLESPFSCQDCRALKLCDVCAGKVSNRIPGCLAITMWHAGSKAVAASGEEDTAVAFTPERLPLVVVTSNPGEYTDWRLAQPEDSARFAFIKTYVRMGLPSGSGLPSQLGPDEGPVGGKRGGKRGRGPEQVLEAHGGASAVSLQTGYVTYRQLCQQWNADERRQAVRGLLVELVPEGWCTGWHRVDGTGLAGLAKAGRRGVEKGRVMENARKGRGGVRKGGKGDEARTEVRQTVRGNGKRAGRGDAGRGAGKRLRGLGRAGEVGRNALQREVEISEGGVRREHASAQEEEEEEAEEEEEEEQEEEGAPQTPSMVDGEQQVWWAPFTNTFYLSCRLHQPDLQCVSRHQAQAARPTTPLDEQWITGMVYFDGASTASQELRLGDWMQAEYADAVWELFDGLPAWMLRGAAAGAGGARAARKGATGSAKARVTSPAASVLTAPLASHTDVRSGVGRRAAVAAHAATHPTPSQLQGRGKSLNQGQGVAQGPSPHLRKGLRSSGTGAVGSSAPAGRRSGATLTPHPRHSARTSAVVVDLTQPSGSDSDESGCMAGGVTEGRPSAVALPRTSSGRCAGVRAGRGQAAMREQPAQRSPRPKPLPQAKRGRRGRLSALQQEAISSAGCSASNERTQEEGEQEEQEEVQQQEAEAPELLLQLGNDDEQL